MAKQSASKKGAGGDSEQRDQVLQRTLEHIEKQYGKGAIMRMGESLDSHDVTAISTGSLSIDIALGVGGLPHGRVIELFGPEGSGKTTLALHVIANAQKKGGVAALIDAEHALSVDYARGLGVDIDNLLLTQPDTAEQALDICECLVRSNAVDVVAIDSVAALVPQAEMEGEIGDTTVGLQARIMSKALRRLTGSIAKSKTCVIFINQIREKIGVMFGSPETTPGGRALKFYSSVRLEVRRITSLKEGDRTVGNRCRVKVVKNKVAKPFTQAEFDMLFDGGISREGDLIDLGAELKFVNKSGSWFSYGDLRLGQGRENSRLYLIEHPELTDELEDKILEQLDPVLLAKRKGITPAPKEAEADKK